MVAKSFRNNKYVAFIVEAITDGGALAIALHHYRYSYNNFVVVACALPGKKIPTSNGSFTSDFLEPFFADNFALADMYSAFIRSQEPAPSPIPGDSGKWMASEPAMPEGYDPTWFVYAYTINGFERSKVYCKRGTIIDWKRNGTTGSVEGVILEFSFDEIMIGPTNGAGRNVWVTKRSVLRIKDLVK